jgi:hypothetical protein
MKISPAGALFRACYLGASLLFAAIPAVSALASDSLPEDLSPAMRDLELFQQKMRGEAITLDAKGRFPGRKFPTAWGQTCGDLAKWPVKGSDFAEFLSRKGFDLRAYAVDAASLQESVYVFRGSLGQFVSVHVGRDGRKDAFRVFAFRSAQPSTASFGRSVTKMDVPQALTGSLPTERIASALADLGVKWPVSDSVAGKLTRASREATQTRTVDGSPLVLRAQNAYPIVFSDRAAGYSCAYDPTPDNVMCTCDKPLGKGEGN